MKIMEAGTTTATPTTISKRAPMIKIRCILNNYRPMEQDWAYKASFGEK